ncbi:chromatin assembly factor 1 subunit A isoform X1 [Entelurus aequoreus]|uniref:chromatin assembly factor 1 subunit A isoform X1 n=1 Tax=Entelurus aequoreus TaxID=161455 RepID=UPI002B1E5095|nr:chromatin assembly factor 1 subunit A isoform X1 [Entelurus aequoreus]
MAAETASVEGLLAASTTRRRGMGRKTSSNANKKLVQARLPFKRLNPEGQEKDVSKRPRPHACPEAHQSDRENANESSPLAVLAKTPLVDGRGPLDCFLSHRRPSAPDQGFIDLTEDTLSPVKSLTSEAAPATSVKDQATTWSPRKTSSADNPAAKQELAKEVQDQDKATTWSPRKTSSADHPAANQDLAKGVQDQDQATTSSPKKTGRADHPAAKQDLAKEAHDQDLAQLNTTRESDGEELKVSHNVSSLGNVSTQSPSSSTSTPESSPERSKPDGLTPSSTPSEPANTPKVPADQKRTKRRSLKTQQEQEARLRVRQERERLKEEAKAAKDKKREESRRLKEEREKEKREKKEKEEQERREKKEKEEWEKAERVKAKEEQRKSKIEAKLEEKRKKEEEKRMKEKKERIKAEKAEITRFLQKSKIQQAPKTLAAACGKFAPFEIKENMYMAPLCRVECEESALEELDRYLSHPTDSPRSLGDWINQKPRRSDPTRARLPNTVRDCIAVDGPTGEGVPDRQQYGPMKLLLFHQNHRPAYWGTWRKKSRHITARCPFRQDKDLLDYEVDSDEEWEEEEPGESLSHSEGEDEEEGGEEDEDEDDGFLVPHGYLSDDEGALEEEEGGDLEKQKLQQKVKAREWDELMSTKNKMRVLQPVVRGCVWEGGDAPSSDLLQSYAVCIIQPLVKADASPSSDDQRQKLLGQLLPLLHGNMNSSKVIIDEFQEFCRRQTSSSMLSTELSSPENSADVPTRIKVKRLIKTNAVYEKRSTYRRCCWYVHADVLTRFSLDTLPVPCHWSYLTCGAREESSREENHVATGSRGNSPSTPQTSSATWAASNKRKSAGSMSITKFMKRCSEHERAEEADGFQADTEDDDDCIIVSTQSGSVREKSSTEGEDLMDVTPSNMATLPLASAAPTLAPA